MFKLEYISKLSTLPEKPEMPQSLSVTEIQSRAVRLSWSAGFDGNSPLHGYTVQYTPLSTQARGERWENAATLNVTWAEHAGHTHSHVTLVKQSFHFNLLYID